MRTERTDRNTSWTIPLSEEVLGQQTTGDRIEKYKWAVDSGG